MSSGNPNRLTILQFCRLSLLTSLAGIWLSGCTNSASQSIETEVCSDGTFLIEANFEGANMGLCEVLAPARFRLSLTPEDQPVNPSPWYAFKVISGQGELSVELHYELHKHRYLPKVSLDGKTWSRLNDKDVAANQDGTVVTLTLNVPDSPIWIAGQELMVQSDYEFWMSDLADRYGASYSVIGQSKGGRPIFLLETKNSKDKQTLVLLGRAHPPEVTGAIAMRHFVDRLFDKHQALLADYDLFIVPLLNPDGVASGYWRHGLGGLDLNRDWGPFSQPETSVVLAALNQRIECGDQPRLMLDFHSTHRNVFYTQTDEEDAQMGNFTKQWLEQARGMGVYPFEHARRHNTDLPTSKNYFHTRFGIPAITFELGDNTPRDEIITSSQKFADALVSVLRTQVDDAK
ncbi:MAG: M14 family zinc carboxypeptidase [Pseudomonadota bacterium]